MHNGLLDCARQQRRPIHLLNLDWQDCAVFSEAAFDADNFGILKYADGVIVERKALAFELAAEKLMIAQKWMVQQANHEAKPVFL